MKRLLACVAVVGAALIFATSVQAQVDVPTPGDPIELVNGINDGDGDAGPPPAGEGVENAINNLQQKYLNFLDLGSGFTVTPALGSGVGGTIVTGLRLYTANDAEERDPASYLLEGSTTGSAGPFATISQGALALPAGRNDLPGNPPIDLTFDYQELLFANASAYTTYRLTFPTLKDAAAANSMQIGEVELLGAVVPEPSAVVLAGLAALGLIALVRRKE
jgi:PEP-CTERM motif